MKHGNGEMVWSDLHETYSGEWENGLPSGYGTYTWSNGSDAIVKNNRRHQFPCSNRYQGYWKEGKRHGQGIFQYSSGARYEGEWKDNMKHGQGIYISENGRQFKGEFAFDRMAHAGATAAMDKVDKGECQYIFKVADFVANEEELAISLRQVNNVLLRDMNKLFSVYNYYCERRLKWGGGGGIGGTISRLEIWHLLNKCKIEKNWNVGVGGSGGGGGGVSLVDINRRNALVFKAEIYGTTRYTVIFRVFKESMMVKSEHTYVISTLTL